MSDTPPAQSPDVPSEPPTTASDDIFESVRHWVGHLEGAVVKSAEEVLGPVMGQTEARVVPAWKRVTDGEARWPMSLGVIAALVLQVTLPNDVVVRPRWLLPSLGAVLLAALVAANPRRINRRSAGLRAGSLALIAVISVANAWSAGRLVLHLLHGTGSSDPARLLSTAGAIWVTNVIAFGLWYWELDRGGPVGRAHGLRAHPDFLFAQMDSPELAPPDWEPGFVDYLYLSFTNAAAFSPTDVLPLSRWAKLTMMLQSAVSLATVALVVARAVNTLR